MTRFLSYQNYLMVASFDDQGTKKSVLGLGLFFHLTNESRILRVANFGSDFLPASEVDAFPGFAFPGYAFLGFVHQQFISGRILVDLHKFDVLEYILEFVE